MGMNIDSLLLLAKQGVVWLEKAKEKYPDIEIEKRVDGEEVYVSDLSAKDADQIEFIGARDLVFAYPYVMFENFKIYSFNPYTGPKLIDTMMNNLQSQKPEVFKALIDFAK